MDPRKIHGLTKAEFLETCIAKADELNPNWQREIFKVENFISKIIWQSSTPTTGFALSAVGSKFFNEALQLKPYYLDTKRLSSRSIIKLATTMPWPYAIATFPGVLTTRIAIYSSEVAVWAALYANDLDQLLEAYSRT